MENGLAAMEMEPLELGELCREVLARMGPMLGHCRLQTDISGAFPVRGDAQSLKMAVKDFLSNAAAHTPDGGEVLLRLAAEGSQVRLTVANQGAHIPADRLERVWDSFYKVDEARVRDGEPHAGLGLAIVKSIVTRHGGACRAENTADGVAFSFTLPMQGA